MDICKSFKKSKDFLICIDSDGCAMDTMDIKHIQCFGPCMVEMWNLETWQEPILRRWNEINLYTMTRGINRFKALALALKEIDTQYCRISDLETLERWVATAGELSNAALKAESEKTGSESLKKALGWSEAVNQAITQMPDSFKKPFNGVKEALALAHQYADIAIVSSANPEAVKEEWERYGLMQDVDIMLTQDAGSKAFCIGEMLKTGFEPDHVLMVGDAPGDRDAAVSNGVLYYPILVRKEEESWKQFSEEALKRFCGGTYLGTYQEQMVTAFEKNLSK